MFRGTSPNMAQNFDKSSDCEGRRTMLENLKTNVLPEGMGPHLDNPLVCVIDTVNESAPCNSDLHRQAELAKKGVLNAGDTPFGGFSRLLSPTASSWATRA